MNPNNTFILPPSRPLEVRLGNLTAIVAAFGLLLGLTWLKAPQLFSSQALQTEQGNEQTAQFSFHLGLIGETLLLIPGLTSGDLGNTVQKFAQDSFQAAVLGVFTEKTPLQIRGPAVPIPPRGAPSR